MNKSTFLQVNGEGDLAGAGLTGSFVRIENRAQDFSVVVNGVHVVRLDKAQDFFSEILRPEVATRLTVAKEYFSEEKVAQLLDYDPRQDYLLPAVLPVVSAKPPTSYYIAYKVFSMSPEEIERSGIEMGASRLDGNNEYSKKEIIGRLCRDYGVSGELVGYSSKKMKQNLLEICSPLVSGFKDRVSGETMEAIIDLIAKRYTPDSLDNLKQGVSRVALVFQELYGKSKSNGIIMPKGEQLVTFFLQISDRAFGERNDPLKMLIVSCPRYGEFDEYETLEEGVSQTASTYLRSLPALSSAFSRGNIPFEGLILVNDTEEKMADGRLLERLGLTKDTYRMKCQGNVDAINQAILDDDRLVGIKANLFTQVFPQFMDITTNIEKQLFHLALQEKDLKTGIAQIADMRLDRHKKIMGGTCDFSESFYLSLHYSAEYIALGYLCRLYPGLNNNSFILNYNSPNVEQFNSQDLLSKCTNEPLQQEAGTIPVIQVKFY